MGEWLEDTEDRQEQMDGEIEGGRRLEEVEDLREEVEGRRKDVEDLQEEVEDRGEEVEGRQEEVEDLQEEVEARREEVEDRREEIEVRREEVADRHDSEYSQESIHRRASAHWCVAESVNVPWVWTFLNSKFSTIIYIELKLEESSTL